MQVDTFVKRSPGMVSSKTRKRIVFGGRPGEFKRLAPRVTTRAAADFELLRRWKATDPSASLTRARAFFIQRSLNAYYRGSLNADDAMNWLRLFLSSTQWLDEFGDWEFDDPSRRSTKRWLPGDLWMPPTEFGWVKEEADRIRDTPKADRRLKELPKPLEVTLQHFDWLVEFQIGSKDLSAIARASNVSQRAVALAVRHLAARLEINLRRRSRGGRPRKPRRN